jgi:hypothetical protein
LAFTPPGAALTSITGPVGSGDGRAGAEVRAAAGVRAAAAMSCRSAGFDPPPEARDAQIATPPTMPTAVSATIAALNRTKSCPASFEV